MKRRPPELFLLYFIHFILSINALAGGLAFVIKPDGLLLGMQNDWLQKTPFPNYFVPGLILFVFNGLFPLLTLIGLIYQPRWKYPSVFNLYPSQHWSWTFSLFCGFILIGWITVQISITPHFWLQPCLLFLGLLILICTLLPRVIRFYSVTENHPLIWQASFETMLAEPTFIKNWLWNSRLLF